MIVVYSTSMTLNGFIASHDDSLDWLFQADATTLPDHAEFVATIGTQVMGANTYEWLIYSQGILDQPEMWTSVYGDMPVFVLTTRQLPVPKGANVTFISGDIREHVSALATAADGKNIWIAGGGDIAGQFAEAGLLDEIVLQVAPAALSSGKPVFTRELTAHELSLVEVKQYGDFAQLRYEVGERSEA